MNDCANLKFNVIIIELSHDKTNKVACAPSEDSDQSGYPQADLSLRWAHMPYIVGFVMTWLIWSLLFS